MGKLEDSRQGMGFRELSADRLAYLNLAREIEDFLYDEMDTLDNREFERWLTYFAEDLRYWMPMRKNMAFREHHKDITGPDDAAWIDDDKALLTKRVKQILTGIHWAEEPLSRVSHIITNIRFDKSVTHLSDGQEVEVKSGFLVHRNRLETETDFLAGRRVDLLRRSGDSFLIARRTIIIDQSVLLAKNLTFFF
ncbi:3-phenylpropionate/cinnamic acid dioxygenase subunit beta [Phenylobacterium sp. VNQ135]|uniref:3-phenylpropionate/cinnamic acid dioxygenase subunit beta n=1 Tax=Phenylobacterium sp. VNQ135 TaxID=3400922 RepID=UPI003C09F7DC